MWLTRLSITRPITILMLVVTLVILGLQSRSRLPVDLYPDIQFPMLFISVAYPGTGPEEMETLVTKPIEDQLSTISGLKKMSSTSAEGISQISMEFELGTDVDDAAADVRSKLDAVRNALPQDAKAPVVTKMDVGAIPVIVLNVSSEKMRSTEVRQLADDLIKDRLSQIPGVASVSVSGGDVREIRVEVDKNRLEAYNLNINQVVSALKSENLNLPSGTIEEQTRNFAVRMMGEFENPEQIYAVRIPNAAGSTNLCVGDVAKVVDTVAKPATYTRVNNGPSVRIVVQKQSDANTVKVVDTLKEELEKLTSKPFTEANLELQREGKYRSTSTQAPEITDEVTVTTSWDQSTFIKDSLHDVYESLWLGALLAVLIVFLFLHSLRGTFIVALAIPTSMIATFMIMDLLDFSINMMSMLGLSLSVGILVDDSIVVIENIHRHLKMGKSPKEAAIAGRTEIGLAAMTITMVDVVVFVPIAFMGGIVGQFFRQFGMVVAAATLFSLFISFTLTPMLASRWLKSHEEEEAEEDHQREHPGLFRRFTNAWEGFYSSLENRYRSILAWSLDHHAAVICLGTMTFLTSIGTAFAKPQLDKPQTVMPMLVLIILLALCALIGSILSRARRTGHVVQLSGAAKPLWITFACFTLVILFLPTKFGFEFSPKVDQRQLTINIEQAVGTPLDVTDATVRKIEHDLTEGHWATEVKTAAVSVGGSEGRMGGGGSTGADTAQISVELVDNTQPWWTVFHGRKHFRSTDEVIADINARYKSEPGVKITAAMPSGGGPGGSPISIEVTGSDMARIKAVAEDVERVVKETEGTTAVELSWRDGRPELQARIDRDRAAQYGLSVAQIASALRTSMEGDTTSKYREGGKEYDIRVSLPESQRLSIVQVPDMVVGNTANGHPVYLYEVVRMEPAGGPTKIERKNRQRAVTVSGQLQQGYTLGNIQQDLIKRLEGVDTHGVKVTWSGQAEEMNESFATMFGALLLSVALVFILMAALFESVISPFIVWLSVPQAMAGALMALTITHKSLSIVSMVGIIMLVGLVTKNAILLVDYTNTLRKDEGLDRRQALLQAGPTRLRPILMTTLAMIFGMMPTALALSNGSEMRQPMAITVIGGLLLALFLSLLMVPTFYEIVDNFGNWYARLKDRITGKAGI